MEPGQIWFYGRNATVIRREPGEERRGRRDQKTANHVVPLYNRTRNVLLMNKPLALATQQEERRAIRRGNC